MLTKRQLRDIHEEDVPLHVLELDYIECVLLKGIYRMADHLVFKGGTCLRKVYGLNRFSEDLDFSVAGRDIAEDMVREAMQHGLTNMEKSGIEAQLRDWEERSNVFLGRVTYHGPLYTGLGTSQGNIEIEVSKLVPFYDSEWKTMITEYPDSGTYSIQSMRADEILAEKFRSLRQRRKPRDFYDTWFLVKKGVMTDIKTVNRKLAEVGLEQAVSLTDIIKEYQVGQKEWERDLRALVGRIPDLSTIKEEIRSSLLAHRERKQ